MIYIGKKDEEKSEIIAKYLAEHKSIIKIVILGDHIDLSTTLPIDEVDWKGCVMYVNYYRLLSTIDLNTLFVWNDILKSKNRYCLEYNCIRKFAQQTKDRLIFNEFPCREKKEEFLTMVDIDSENPFLKLKWEDYVKFENVKIAEHFLPNICVIDVGVTDKVKEKYEALKLKVASEVKKDPDIIPRKLLKFSEEENKRAAKTIFDSKSKIQKTMVIGLNELKVDKYYYGLMLNAIEEMKNVSKKV
jgi:hypothetical protein